MIPTEYFSISIPSKGSFRYTQFLVFVMFGTSIISQTFQKCSIIVCHQNSHLIESCLFGIQGINPLEWVIGSVFGNPKHHCDESIRQWCNLFHNQNGKPIIDIDDSTFGDIDKVRMPLAVQATTIISILLGLREIVLNSFSIQGNLIDVIFRGVSGSMSAVFERLKSLFQKGNDGVVGFVREGFGFGEFAYDLFDCHIEM